MGGGVPREGPTLLLLPGKKISIIVAWCLLSILESLSEGSFENCTSILKLSSALGLSYLLYQHN